MSHVIGRGRQRTTTYKTRPAPVSTNTGSPIVRIGFGNSIQAINYAGTFSPMFRDVDTLLTVPLTDFTPGNIILIGYSVALQQSAPSEDGIGMFVRATIDVDGGGQRAIVPESIGVRTLEGTNFSFLGMGWKTFFKPPALSVTATPIIGLEIDANQGNFGSVTVIAGAALLWAAEVDASFVTQDPDTSLEP